MKLIKMRTRASRAELLSILSNSDLVNDGVAFNEKKGRPRMLVKEGKGDAITVSCKLVGGATKDNGFVLGATKFRGRLTERDGVTTLSGVILTAPVYITVLVALLALFVGMCIYLGGFNPVPPICFIFGLYLISGEYAKQGMIDRYFRRAIKRAEMR